MGLLLAALALGFACLEAFGPRGFSFRDETFCFQQALSFQAGYPWSVTWGNGNLLKLAQFSLYSFSHSFNTMHLPALLAYGLHGLLLYGFGRRLGGPRVGVGAALAGLLSAMALVQARSLLPFAILPALLALSLTLCLRGPAAAFLGGLLLACGFLEYEATAFALPGAVAFLWLEPKLKRSPAWTAALGFALGMAGVLWVCRDSLAQWWAFRMAYNQPLGAGSGSGLAARLWQWFFGGDNEAYLGVTGHGSFPLWALPLALLGLGLEGRRRPWLPLWLALSLLALLPASRHLEPQRALAAVLPLVLAAGFGWRWLWLRARSRAWLAALLLVLPALGLWQETAAFERSMRLGQSDYARSQLWTSLRQRHGFSGQVNGALLPVGLSWESALGLALDPGQASYVWFPSDLDRDAPKGPVLALQYPDASYSGDLLVSLPPKHPLRQDLDFLRPFWLRLSGLRESQRERSVEACRLALAGHTVQTPLGRAALWGRLLDDAIQRGLLAPADLGALDREAFRSPFFYRTRMIFSWPKDLRLTYWLCAQLRKNCGAEKLREDERELLTRPWAELPRAPGSPDWPEPNRSNPNPR